MVDGKRPTFRRSGSPGPLLHNKGLVLGVQPNFCSAAQVKLLPEPDWDAGHDGGTVLGEGCHTGSPPWWGQLLPLPCSTASSLANSCSATCILSGSRPALGAPSKDRGSPACCRQLPTLPPLQGGWCKLLPASAPASLLVKTDGSMPCSFAGHGAGPDTPACLHRLAWGEPRAAAGRGRQEQSGESSLPARHGSTGATVQSC